MAIPEKIARQVAVIIREHLAGAFPPEVVFDPIEVVPDIDCEGKDSLHITVVCDGEVSLLDPAKLNAITVAMWPQLAALGVQSIPAESYIDKAEYDEWASLSEEERWLEVFGELDASD